MARVDNISVWNSKIDQNLTRRTIGGQGIKYEFILPYGANPDRYWEEAMDVRSIKGNNRRPSTAKGKEGIIYRPGQYQPVGDKSHFTFYQLKKQNKKMADDDYTIKVVVD
jgi:hypothetical protein